MQAMTDDPKYVRWLATRHQVKPLSRELEIFATWAEERIVLTEGKHKGERKEGKEGGGAREGRGEGPKRGEGRASDRRRQSWS